ncbi:protein kinase (macronuclear) [Tetrahymena thermophila SB210]|uniref:Protein kinase n=1 Tax=Tetrahymena thermophila (strain SB210) TaxID=312017 RepID=Q23BQ8_TETTS|nr:protein kinase [Tetrahymena thermophila SB210]EAR94060.2 protein kinase [Tetrahymena thermophila SB210]|eukprot:XP_001014305.2 protein kinase [Tetrahymena thermophila SB210]
MQQLFDNLKDLYSINLIDKNNDSNYEEVQESKIIFVEKEQQDYALKIINLNQSESNKIDDERLQQQLIYVQFLKKTNHPNIVRCYDYYVIGNYLCILMEKYQYNLSQCSFDYGCMDWDETNKCRLYQFFDILNAVSFIHQSGFLIRKLSLSKIVFDDDYRLKIYDFQVQSKDLSLFPSSDQNLQSQFRIEQQKLFISCNQNQSKQQNSWIIGTFLYYLCIRIGENKVNMIIDLVEGKESFKQIENLHQDLNNVLKLMIQNRNQENIIVQAMSLLSGVEDYQEIIKFLQDYQLVKNEEEQYPIIKRGKLVRFNDSQPHILFEKLNKFLLQKYPENIEYIIDRVIILQHVKENFEISIELCQRALKIDCNNEQAEQYLCLSLAEKYKDKYIDYFLEFLLRFPENQIVISRLASAYYDKKQYQNALETYSQLLLLIDKQETKILSKYWVYIFIGQILRKMKKYEESINFFNLSIEYYEYKNGLQITFQELVKSYTKLEKYQVAIGYLQKIEPNLSFRKYYMGKIYFKLEKYEESLKYLQSIRINYNYKLQGMISEIYFNLKVYDKAVESYKSNR